MHELLNSTTTTPRGKDRTVTHHDFDDVTEVQLGSDAAPKDDVLAEEISPKIQHLGQNPNGSSSMDLSPPVLLTPAEHARQEDTRARLQGDKSPFFD